MWTRQSEILLNIETTEMYMEWPKKGEEEKYLLLFHAQNKEEQVYKIKINQVGR